MANHKVTFMPAGLTVEVDPADPPKVHGDREGSHIGHEARPGGPDDPDYMPVRVVPERVELSKMFGTQDKRVWRG